MDAPDAPDPREGWSRGRIVGVTIGGLLTLGLIVLLVLGLVSKDDPLAIDHALDDGKKVAAPALELPVFTAVGDVGPVGEQVSLEDLRGRPVVLNFWASWCGPCADEAPILERIWTRYRDRGVVVLGVNSEDDPAKAREFVEEYGLTFPNVRTGSDRTRRAFGTNQMPETFVIDPDGNFGMKPFRGQLTAEHEAQITAHLDTVVAR